MQKTAHSLGLLLAAFLWVAAPAPARGQAHIARYFEMLREAPRLMNSQQYDKALDYFRQIIPRLEPDMNKNDSYYRAVEYCYLNSGIAYLEKGQPDQAMEWFEKYLKKFPRSVNRLPVMLLQADIFSQKGKWDEVIRRLQIILKIPALNIMQRIEANELLGEAYFSQDKWADAVQPLLFVLKHARDVDQQTDAAVNIAICLVRLERFKKLFAFLPRVYETVARYDAELHTSLIKEGDHQFDKKEYHRALLLYRLVFSKSEIMEQLSLYIKSLKLKWNLLDAQRGFGIEAAQRRGQKHRLDRVIKRYEKQLEKIGNMPDYDQELLMRIAACYYEMQRYPEAILVYRGLFEDFPDHQLADQALYSTFTTAQSMGDEERTLSEGYEYVVAFPQGRFWDPLTIALMQIHLKREEYTEALGIAARAVELNPKHELHDHLLYLSGICYFQMDDLERALEQFLDVSQRFPESGFREAADFRHALTQLFVSRYTQAREEFSAYLEQFAGGSFTEEATYRLGVAQYGEGNMEVAGETFEAFVERYPESPLTSEAYSMLADVLASEGKLDRALDYYARAIPCAVNIVQVNYAVFQSARTYELEQRYEEIINLFIKYLDDYGQKGNFTEAAYWIGTAQYHQGRTQESLKTFFDAIVSYGDNPRHYGIDMILRDLIREHDRIPDRDALEQFMDRLYQELEKAYIPLSIIIGSKPANVIVGSAKNPSTEIPGMIRGQAGCLVLGRGAGVAAAEAAKQEVPVNVVEISGVQEELRGQGVILEL